MTLRIMSLGKRHSRVCWNVLFSFLISISVAIAQLPTATILGVVHDSSGAVVPEAALTARNLDTGAIRTTTSGRDGSFRLSALPVGNYELKVEHSGFRAEVRSGLLLTIAQEAVVHFTLEVGPIEQTISVMAEPPLVNTTTGSLGGLVDEQRVSLLPLNGRNYIDLTLLQTGVQEHKNILYVAGMAGTSFSSNGAPLRSNNLLLDGASMVNLYGVTSASVSGATLGVEGIREYRVVTNSFSAEYGMTMGSQMAMVSKGGTNTFHGSLFEYLRNSALAARNFFDYKTVASSRRLPAFARNNFGASVGGPIQIDKTFFHGVYEGVRERLGVTKVLRVISPADKADPQIAPVIKPLLSLFPDPNLPNNEFTFPFSQPTREDYGQMRVDHTFSVHDMMFGRYTNHDANQVKVYSYPQFLENAASRSQYTTVSENHVFSPRLLNIFRFSYSRTKIKLDSLSGLIGPQFSFVPGLEIGTLNIGGVSGLGGDLATPVHHKQNIFTWSDDAFYARGRHSLKFGTLINRYQQYIMANTFARGTVSFANLASFLQARPTSYSAATPDSITDRTYHYTTMGFYLQEDLRVRSNLMLNLGLRYEFLTQPQEVRGHGAALRDVQHADKTTLGPPFLNPSLRNLSPRFGFAWDLRGNGQTAVRGGFGLLYDIGNLGTALMAGTAATPPFSSRSTMTSTPTNPISFTIPFFFPKEVEGKSLRLVDYLIQQPHMLQYNLTVEHQLPFNMALTLAYGGSRGINLITTTEGNPTVPQGVSDGRRCVPASTPPPVRPDERKCWIGTDPRTNPNWADIELKTANANSWYNSFQFGLVKRLSKGLQLQSSYTWSKTMDETQAQQNPENTSSSSFASDPTHRTTDRGLASFDVAHNWRLSTIYRLPALASSAGALGKVLDGWWLSSILSVQSGYPFSPVIQANRSRAGVNGGRAGVDRPDLLPGRSNDNIILGGPDRYFDPNAFSLQPAGFLGTAGRNILRGPGFATLDFSLAKDTALRMLGESGKVEFRAEFFNIFNRANLVTPGIGLGGNNAGVVFAGRSDTETPLATAGRITRTAGTSRQIQLALKILF